LWASVIIAPIVSRLNEAFMRQRIFDMLFKDDRMVVLELAPDITQCLSQRPSGSSTDWAVVTRRNVPGYPVQSVVAFEDRDKALAHYKRMVVETPRLSLGGRSPSMSPTLEEYTRWLAANRLHDPVLNPDSPARFDSSYSLNQPPMRGTA
jgi:hypothetical protein